MMPTCGQCQYGIMEKDVQTRVCHGGPPTPLFTPKGIVGARPIVRAADKECCLFKQKEVAADYPDFKP
jgi:hypothetical protein